MMLKLQLLSLICSLFVVHETLAQTNSNSSGSGFIASVNGKVIDAKNFDQIIKNNVSNGMSVVDYSDYKHQVGKIAGLRTVLELCGVVQSELSKR